MNYFVGNGIAKYCATGLASTLMAVQSLLPASAATPSKDDYPSRPITLVVPSDAGAATDTMARSLANQLAKALNQPVVVENRPGASGAIGASHVARAAPDGYTLLVGPGTAMVVNPMVNKTDYDVDRDFRPIGLLVDAEMVMVARPLYRIQDPWRRPSVREGPSRKAFVCVLRVWQHISFVHGVLAAENGHGVFARSI